MILKLSKLEEMLKSARDLELSALVEAAKGPPKLNELNAEIHVFEVRYGMTSGEMCAGFKAGSVQDTAEIAQWLFLLQIRELISN